MIKYILLRLLWAFVVLFGILFTTFVFLKIQPLEVPAETQAKRVFLHHQFEYGFMTREFIDAIVNPDLAKYWTDVSKDNSNVYVVWQSPKNHNVLIVYTVVPVMIQFGKWLTNVVTKFDWGYSNAVHNMRPATSILATAISFSFKINIFVLLIEIPIGLALGIFSAIKKDSVFDNIVQVIVILFISLPSFVVISLLMKWLGSDLSWVPYLWPMSDAQPSTQALGYVIPVSAMALGAIAGLIRGVRAELSEGLTSDYVLLARTKGLTKRQAIYRHALRNSLLPIIPGLIFSFVFLLSGSAIIERVYGIPGAGAIMLTALQNRDYNIIMLDTAFYGSIGLVCGILIDITYGFIDPRIKMGARNV